MRKISDDVNRFLQDVYKRVVFPWPKKTIDQTLHISLQYKPSPAAATRNEIFVPMNGNNNFMCNPNQIPKNLPLKKRRTYLVDTPTVNTEAAGFGQDEIHRSTTVKQSYGQEDPLQICLPPNVVPTPPSSPQLELLRQQYAYFLANSTNHSQQNLYPLPSYECLMTQKYLAQQFLDHYRTLLEQHYQNQQCAYTLVEDKQKGTDVTIDEHFRKSLGDNYHRFTGGFLTPDESSSNSSPIERTPVDSIEEHFARSLGKFWPLTTSPNEDQRSSVTELDVDDHFSKALGATTWEKLKEKS